MNTDKKYEFTDEILTLADGNTLHRIRALRNFGNVTAGQPGGFIECEKNLSHEGGAWVSDNARISGGAQVSDNARVSSNAWVSDGAQVSGSARVYNNAWVSDGARIQTIDDMLSIGPIGSRDGYTTFFRNKDGGISVRCGCFAGTLEEFAAAVEKTHGANVHGQAYRLAIDLAKLRIVITGGKREVKGAEKESALAK
jgi:hypothetical protein